MTPERLAEIQQRVEDGIALGGDFHSVQMHYFQANADRRALYLYVQVLEGHASKKK